MQKENLFFFSFSNVSTFDRQVKGSENCAKYKEKPPFILFITNNSLSLPARNNKGKNYANDF